MTTHPYRSYAMDLSAYSSAIADGATDVACALPFDDVDHFVSYTLIDAFVNVQSMLDGKAKICFASKCYDMSVDVLRFYRAAMELDYCRRNDLKVLSDPTYGKVISYYQNQSSDLPTFIEDFWRRPISNGWKDKLRVIKRRTICALKNVRMPSHSMDILFSNPLLDGYLEANPSPILELFPYHTFWAETPNSIPEVDQIVDLTVDTLKASMGGLVPQHNSFKSKLFSAIQYMVRMHMNQAFCDFEYIKNTKALRPKHNLLIGGTPKYLGRLLSSFYRNENAKVWRFSHGGERGLFDDYHWGICELTYADLYFMHGCGEANLVRGKLTDERLPMISDNPEITSFPSLRHNTIFKTASNPKASVSEIDVVYVCGSYLAEVGGHFPAFKIPDTKYFEWQLWLLQNLKSLGHRVSVKMHPKGGIKQAQILAPYCDEIIMTPFDQIQFDRACFLFDFPGSAFMDALAMKQNVILFDTGVRPLDPIGKPYLDQRVHRICCSYDQDGLMRADLNDVAHAIDVSRNNRPEQLAEEFVDFYYTNS